MKNSEIKNVIPDLSNTIPDNSDTINENSDANNYSEKINTESISDENIKLKNEIDLRVELFLKGKIKLRQLHTIDLKFLDYNQIGTTRRNYSRLKTYLFGNSTEYDIINKEMGQLHSEIKEKRKGKQL